SQNYSGKFIYYIIDQFPYLVISKTALPSVYNNDLHFEEH
ncbi:39474_t:CDS:1, partial [Gigaspora margarita]